jgi:pantoate--beta-alanine ligase
VEEIRSITESLRREGKVIGFVPTMGFLHEGHLSLVKASKENCDQTLVSIFVNPAQFAPNEDYNKYPRDTERDLALLEKEGVDFVFLPEKEVIYPPGFQTYTEVIEITKKQEGEFRPSHFKGVTTIVAVLFNIIRPHKAFFGQKDAQQTAVIKRMVKDLKFDIEIVVCPTVREEDGLAMSSRNIFLEPVQREKSLVISRSLFQAEKLIAAGEKDVSTVIKTINNNFLKETSIHLNYIRIVDAEDFNEPKIMEKGKEYFILIACKIGGTRLIDNVLVKIPV